jgi:hypothetical protein
MIKFGGLKPANLVNNGQFGCNLNDMKKFILLVLVLVAGFFVYKYAFKKKDNHHEKPAPLSVSKHSDAFNESVAKMLSAYYGMTDGFVEHDSADVRKQALALQEALVGFRADDLKKDSGIYQTVLFPWENSKQNVETILSSRDWNGKKRALQDLSDNLRMILLTVKYDRQVVYWQECPMAFGEDQRGNWLSSDTEVVNPYFGKKDPEQGDKMLRCGETKFTIDFTGADSASKS